MAELGPSIIIHPIIRDRIASEFCDYDLSNEVTYVENDWWYVIKLIELTKDHDVYDLDLNSVDLSILPWECTSILHFVQHMIDMENTSFEYPVIVSPSGWILNGWHRVLKGIIEGKRTIKAVRIFKMPPRDGVEEKDND